MAPVDRPLSSEQQGPWYIVLYEWQGAQDLSDCRTWWPSADILGSWEGAASTIELMRKGETPRQGKLTYRNIRGPFIWTEPAPSRAHPECGI